jgi:hypothetical protein
MADERTNEMTPSAIEREIAQALAVEPSPEFVARVRMRIASEPPPRRVWATWMPVMAGATAVAAAVAIAIVAPWRGSPVRLKPDTITDVRLKPDTTEKIVASATSTVPSATSTAVASGFSRTKTLQAEAQVRLKPDPTEKIVASGFSRTVTEPEVLVPQAEIDMYRRLIARARASSPAALVEAPPEIVASEIVADVQPPPELTIEPIKIDPITPQSSGEGVHP